MATVIAIANQKGGIGKTTTACTLASMLDYAGKKALLIDADMQCNSTDTYNAKTENIATLYDLLKGTEGVTPMDAVQKTSYGEIIPADRLLGSVDIELQKDPIMGIYRMKQFMDPLKKHYDYIIIDTNPTINHLLLNCMVAADQIVIPMLADRFSLIGLQQVLDTVHSVQSLPNKDLKIAGILLIKYKANMVLERNVRKSLENLVEQLNIKLFSTTIRESVAVRMAQAAQTPLIEADFKSNAAKDYRAFVKELCGITIERKDAKHGTK